MTTERDIRIIAGTFDLASLALGTWVNHNRYWFTAFVQTCFNRASRTGA
jgi:hypothetical protein